MAEASRRPLWRPEVDYIHDHVFKNFDFNIHHISGYWMFSTVLNNFREKANLKREGLNDFEKVLGNCFT